MIGNIMNLITSQLNIDQLAPEEQQRIIETLEQKIYDQVISACLEKIDEAQQERLSALLAEGSTDDVMSFLKQVVPDIESIITTISKDVVADFKAMRGL